MRVFDWFFRDRRTGRIVVAQRPNLALWIFLGSVALRLIVGSDGRARTVVDAVGVASLTWWAVDEVLRGVNPFRRLLGLGGCAFAVSGMLALVT